MDIDITKESLCVNKLICEKKDTLTVQGDMIVPDSKPDILNTISTSGNICIYKSEVMDGKMRIDGNIATYIMYLAEGEGENVRGLNTSLDFTETIVIPELEMGMFANVQTSIKTIECKVLNGRKIGIKANVEISVRVYSKQDIEFITNVQNDNIQLLSNNLKVNSLVGQNQSKAYIKETVSVPDNDNLAEILRANICIVDRDIKVSYNKVLAKAETEIKIVYLTEEGKINQLETKLPVVGFVDIPNIKDTDICDTNYVIKNIILKPNNVEEHSIYVEIEIEISCIVYEEKEINLINDLYSPCEKIKTTQENVNIISSKQHRNVSCAISEKANIPELEGCQIIDTEINTIINKETKLNSKIIYEGDVELNFIFEQRNTIGINSKKITIPFEQTIDNVENAENLNIETNVIVNSSQITNQAGSISVNIELNFDIDMFKSLSVPVINNIEEEEEENLEDYSVMLYIVKKGDTLWEIAKKYRSTVDTIARINGIENVDKLVVGQKIYIPKYSRVRSNPVTSYV